MLEKLIQYRKSVAVSLLGVYLSMAFLDILYISMYAKPAYIQAIGHLMRENLIVWPWIMFYAIYGAAIFILAVVANRDTRLSYAAIDGGILGIASYGAYNLTNYSLIDGYSFTVMAVDLIWGISLSAISATCGWLIWQKIATEHLDPTSKKAM